MPIKALEKTVIFHSAFRLKLSDSLLPAGSYRISVDEEYSDHSSVAYRTTTYLRTPSVASPRGSSANIKICSHDLAEALSRDRAESLRMIFGGCLRRP